MARSYHKKSPYWQQSRKPVVVTHTTAAPISVQQVAQAAPLEMTPMFDEKPPYLAQAACGADGIQSSTLRNGVTPGVIAPSFPNISAGVWPYDQIEGNYSAASIIGVTMQAYFNYAVLRNAVNLMADFSVSKLHIKTSNQRVKKFIETWFEAISLNQFMSQFFLEYYRGGNVWVYKFSGKISEDGMNMLKTSYSKVAEMESWAASKKSPIIPIRYILLNPMQVYLQRGASYAYGYVRMLSTYEIERLKNPQTEEDRQIFRSFPDDIQRQIKQGGAWRYLFVPLDQKRLYYVFYRKQDYEPLAVPMAFPVLNDIEFKMDMRRIDRGIVASLEQVMLLVTAGRQADQYNTVHGAKVLQSLQELFQNQAIGRVLVADYTTKAEWIIPDFKNLLGPEKYERVDKDIKEGLQYIFFGEDKFANASVKTRIFIESLREGRRAFLENFLIPEVKKVCEAMNFKNVPKLEFEEIMIQDEALMNRLYVQMAQMGVLDADETFQAMKTGMLPTKEESLKHQEEYKDARKKGLYAPLAPPQQGANGRPGGTGGTPAPRKVATPIGQSKASVGEAFASTDTARDGKYHFGMTRVAENLVKMNGIKMDVEAALIKRFKVKELNAAQQGVAASIAKSIAFNEPEEKWTTSVVAYIKAPKDIDSETAAELIDISVVFDVNSWDAAVLAKSKVDFVPGQVAETEA